MAGVVLVAAAGGFLALRARRQPAVEVRPATAEVPPARFTGELATAPDYSPPSPHVVPVPVQVTNVMKMWREAVIARNTDAVLEADRTFLEERARYQQALIESATGDDNATVRAFSTRVLGKFGNTELGPTFLGLLDDPSPPVRENAVWALGQIGNPGAAGELERLQRGDPSPVVRRAAAQALDRHRVAGGVRQGSR